MSSRQSFLKGALILMLASILVRTLGFVYQVVIVRLIGTEGIGIFNMIYPLYVTALLLTTAGLPTAIAKYIPEIITVSGQKSAENMLARSITTLVIISSLVSLLLLFFSPLLIRHFYTDFRVIPSFLILVILLPIVASASAIRSYFQGLQDMRPTAYNQIVEQVIRFTSGIALVYFLHDYGLVWATVGLASAIFLSEVGGLIYLRKLYHKQALTGKLVALPKIALLSKLFSFGVPLTITRVIHTLLTTLEANLIPRQLIRFGSTLSQATSFYGELTGVAFTLLMIPSTLSFSLATSLVPSISAANTQRQKGQLAKRTTDAISITLLAGVPCAIILYFWGPYMTTLLFQSHQAGVLLQTLTFGCIFLYLAQTSSGILQGIGLVKTIFMTTLISGSIRLFGIYYFGCNPVLGLYGIPLCYVTGYFVLALLNLTVIKIKTGFKLDFSLCLRLGIAGLLLYKLLDISKILVQDNCFNLVVLTILYVFLFFLLLLIMGDKYSRLILHQFRKER